MLRLAVPLLVATAAVAAAAPVPGWVYDPARIRALYGTPDEAAGRCTLRLRGTELSVRTPGSPDPGGYRLSRTVSGDFDVRVKLAFLDAPPRSFGPSKGQLKTEAGLIAGADGHFLSVYRYRQYHLDNGKPQEGLDEAVWVDQNRPDGGTGSRLADGPDGAVWLGLVRKAGVVSVLWSPDGKEWAEPWPADEVKLPDRLTLSLIVATGTDQECEARFDGYKLTVPPGK